MGLPVSDDEDERVMRLSRGRILQAKVTATAKALKQEQEWHL
jgi:hypothetical protein